MREDAIKRAKLSMESDRIKVNALKEKRSGQDASKVEGVKAYESKNLKVNEIRNLQAKKQAREEMIRRAKLWAVEDKLQLEEAIRREKAWAAEDKVKGDPISNQRNNDKKMERVAKKKAKMEALRRAREWGAEDRDRRSLRIDVPRTGTVHVSVKEEDAHDSKNCSWFRLLFGIAFYLIVAHCSIEIIVAHANIAEEWHQVRNRILSFSLALGIILWKILRGVMYFALAFLAEVINRFMLEGEKD